MDRWVDEWTDGQVGRWVDGQVDGWMDEQVGRQVGGWVGGWLTEEWRRRKWLALPEALGGFPEGAEFEVATEEQEFRWEAGPRLGARTHEGTGQEGVGSGRGQCDEGVGYGILPVASADVSAPELWAGRVALRSLACGDSG